MRRVVFVGVVGLGAIGARASDDVQFTPDRPGFGESTGTPGVGHVLLQGSVAGVVSDGPVQVGTSGLTGRYGVAKGLELRLGVPDVS